VEVAIAHAAWHPERGATLARLVKQLAEQGAKIHVSVSARKEHAAIWATRLWEYGAYVDEPVVCLNDDVIVSPDFVATCEAIALAVPDEVVSLHTQVPGAELVKGPWVRCYWLTGPAYMLPPGAARSLLDYPLPWEFVSRINEDNRAIHWAWERQRPFYSVTVAPVTHDVGTSSTLGYDKHPHRLPRATWADHPQLDLTEPEYWSRGCDDAPYLANPWLSAEFLDLTRAAVKAGQPMCIMCAQAPAVVGTKSDAAICGRCSKACWESIVKRAT
jgi:hypothetical protein